MTCKRAGLAVKAVTLGLVGIVNSAVYKRTQLSPKSKGHPSSNPDPFHTLTHKQGASVTGYHTERTIINRHNQLTSSHQTFSIIMPHLPFSTTSSPSSSPRSSPSTPSIVLHPASGITDRSNCGFPSDLQAGTSSSSSSKRELYRSADNAASAYRTRYAQYLAATFNMSLEAALAEADTQLQQAPRRCSDVSEAEVLRES
ncbi:uncharacterized protein EI97DRAFT_458455 [Westerdykella ornata]|uniref:Uncharacterized protein n=1 Tax=Westerdykella ornata TaxID=318751 RepID=A0A6A6JJY4_WESOR|nr:uncharacterized protein EI97DRAFT_458455 [Westerdykella ornata]KAF2276535.1 hypothetical protein EI97DRAFT_458455 [Westerdykella ornata]